MRPTWFDKAKQVAWLVTALAILLAVGYYTHY